MEVIITNQTELFIRHLESKPFVGETIIVVNDYGRSWLYEITHIRHIAREDEREFKDKSSLVLFVNFVKYLYGNEVGEK